MGQEITPAALAFPPAADFQFANVADFYQAKPRNPKTFSYFFVFWGLRSSFGKTAKEQDLTMKD